MGGSCCGARDESKDQQAQKDLKKDLTKDGSPTKQQNKSDKNDEMANTAHKSNADDMQIFEQDERRSREIGDQGYGGGYDSDDVTEQYTSNQPSVPKVCSIDHVNYFFEEFIRNNKRQDLITISLTFEEFNLFFEELEQIIQALQRATEWIYMPISISNNLKNINSEVIVALRVSHRFYNFPSTGWEERTPTKIAARYSIVKSQEMFAGNYTNQGFKEMMQENLQQWHHQKKQMFVGGFQDDKNQMIMLLYQLQGNLEAPEFFIEIQSEHLDDLSDEEDGSSFGGPTEFHPDEKMKHLNEKIVNEAHCNVDMNAHLRCVVTVRRPQLEHFFILQKQEGDRMYYIANFNFKNDSELTRLIQDRNSAEKSNQTDTDLIITRMRYDVYLTDLLNSAENLFGDTSAMVALMVNEQTRESFAITAT